jgi:gamma-glutamyltranspeptidase/glutathione hydrolase
MGAKRRQPWPQTACSWLEGKPMAFNEAVVGGRSVGVPGLLRMLAKAHQQHGALPWAQLFEPAIALAEQGFPCQPTLARLAKRRHQLATRPPSRCLFLSPRWQALARWVTACKTLPWPHIFKRIAQEGAEVFYSGGVAQAMVDKVQQHPTTLAF